MRVLVCGGRNFGVLKEEHRFIFRTLDKLLCPTPTDDPETWLPPKDLVIISGGATGVDRAAVDWAVVNWTMFEEYKADWKTHGKRAGYIRNKQMLDEGKPNLVVAFPGGKGTANMVDIAKRAGIEVIEIQYEDIPSQ